VPRLPGRLIRAAIYAIDHSSAIRNWMCRSGIGAAADPRGCRDLAAAVAIYNVHLLPVSSLEYTTETRMQFADLLTA